MHTNGIWWPRWIGLGVMATALWLSACATPEANPGGSSDRIDATLADVVDEVALEARVLILGEQHDVPEHHRLHALVVRRYAGAGELGALLLEMAEAGNTTDDLPADASEEQVKAALRWDDRAWPWPSYGPAVMAAVRAGVPVVGANHPRARIVLAMRDEALQRNVAAEVFAVLREQVRQGHCDLLPEGQLDPMTRVQVARDQSMAFTAVARWQRHAKRVILLTGAFHADQRTGVPWHIRRQVPSLAVRSLVWRATPPSALQPLTPADREAAARSGTPATIPRAARTTPISGQAGFDAVWVAGLSPEVDYCAQAREQFSRPR
jgi:uncharacterized iron-regulated protein